MNQDSELLRRYVDERSETAFSALVERYVNLVYSTALRTVGGDAHQARDIVQGVFTTLAQKSPALTTHPKLAGWLYRTTHHLATKTVRAEQRRVAREHKAHVMEEDHRSEESVSRDEIRPVIDWAMKGLAERDREIVLRRVFAGQAFEEISTALGITEPAARMRFERALEKLRGRFARKGIASTSGALAVAMANEVAAAPVGLAASVTGAVMASGPALTAGAGTATISAGIVHIMSTKTVTAIVTAVALLATGAAFLQTQRAREQSSLLDEARRSLAAMARKNDNLSSRLKQAEERRGEMQDRLTAVDANQSAPVSLRLGPTAKGTAESLKMNALKNPAARAAYLQATAVSAKTQLTRFFAAKGISPEQQDTVLKLTVGYVDGDLELQEAKGRLGLGPSDPLTPAALVALDPSDAARLKKIQLDFTQEFMTGVKNTLGQENGAAFFDYERAGDERRLVDEFVGQLNATDAPLTAQQAEQLTTILAQSRFRYKAPTSPTNTMGGIAIDQNTWSSAQAQRNAISEIGGMWNPPITDEAIGKAQAILSPAQLSALKLLQAQQAANLQATPGNRPTL